jgi:hypothetical protein
MLGIAKINPHLGRRVIGLVDATPNWHPLYPAVTQLLDVDVGLLLELFISVKARGRLISGREVNTSVEDPVERATEVAIGIQSAQFVSERVQCREVLQRNQATECRGRNSLLAARGRNSSCPLLRLGGRNPAHDEVFRVNNQAVVAVVIDIGNDLTPEFSASSVPLMMRGGTRKSRLSGFVNRLLCLHFDILVYRLRRRPSNAERIQRDVGLLDNRTSFLN